MGDLTGTIRSKTISSNKFAGVSVQYTLKISVLAWPGSHNMVAGKRCRKSVCCPEIQRTAVGLLFCGGILCFLAVSSVFGAVFGCGSVLEKANSLGRQCLVPVSGEFSGEKKLKIALVTCSDESRKLGRRSFNGMMKLVEVNKKRYAVKQGYDFLDASKLVDKNRPPSWSKIIAVKAHLRDYDWIFWNDADSIITNSSISLEKILYAIIGDTNFESSPDLIVTEDVTGINAGMFFIRNSRWSMNFLDIWWNQTAFIRGFGSSKSGDNDALKHLIKQLPENELRNHVRVSSMQCLFNSYPWFPAWKTTFRFLSSPKTIWQGVYSKGDFMVHLAGLDDKKEWTLKILGELNESLGNGDR